MKILTPLMKEVDKLLATWRCLVVKVWVKAMKGVELRLVKL